MTNKKLILRVKLPKPLYLRLMQDEIEVICRKYGVLGYKKAADAAMTAIAGEIYRDRWSRESQKVKGE